MTRFSVTARLGFGVLLLASAGAAAAQPKPEGRAAVLKALTDCRGVADGAQRLACFDAAAAGLEAAESKGDIVVVDREQARQVRRQAFGFTLPSLAILDREGGGDAGDDEITLKVLAASRGGDGKWVLRLEGDQTWRQIDTTEVARYPKAGGTVTIKRAMMGSYKLSTGGAAAMRVHRDD